MKFAEELLADIKSNLFEASLQGEKECEEILHETSLEIYDETVYKPYMEGCPHVYQRRYTKGGFGDRENIKGEVTMVDDTYFVEVSNDTIANGDDTGEYLDYFIEEGIYEWGHTPPPRPFAIKGQNEVNNTSRINEIIESSMKSKGYNIK